MKDRLERKTYRKSPGRQYDSDPLRSRSGLSQYGRRETHDDPWEEETITRANNGSEVHLAPRPDLRRTRQLLRQSILANKTRLADPDYEHHLTTEDEDVSYHEQPDSTLFSNRHQARQHRPAQHLPPVAPQRLVEPERAEEEWREFDDFVDPDAGYEDPLDQQAGFSQALPIRSDANPPAVQRISGNHSPARVSQRLTTRNVPLEEEEEEVYEEEERPRRRKKKGVTRRRLLWGLGIAAAGGTAIAAYELVPKLPKAIGDVGTNIEHQLQDAFNRGVTQGANEARKAIINELDNLEGVSLEVAVTAARLTRIAYDTFVSPLVTLASTVTGDFLNLTLRALIQGRRWLANIGQDNSTLQALQTVLETWVKQVTNMPKQLQSITDTDLDGAQAYLRALQQKIKDEQAKLNGQATATPSPGPTKTRTP